MGVTGAVCAGFGCGASGVAEAAGCGGTGGFAVVNLKRSTRLVCGAGFGDFSAALLSGRLKSWGKGVGDGDSIGAAVVGPESDSGVGKIVVAFAESSYPEPPDICTAGIGIMFCPGIP